MRATDRLTDGGGGCVCVRAKGSTRLEDAVASVFGAKFLKTLAPVRVDLDDAGATHVRGLVSKAGHGVGRANNDRQFFFVNGRPVDVPKVSSVRYGRFGCRGCHHHSERVWPGRVRAPADRACRERGLAPV